MKKLNNIIALAFLVISAIACQNSQSSTDELLVLDSSTSQSAKVDSSQKSEIVVDVRTEEEWNSDGHASCSINIPLDELEQRVGELKDYGMIKLVCRSGNRAEAAKEILSRSGFQHLENLGSWQNVECK